MMTDNDRDKLLLEVAQRTAWIKGKLEEVHLRTAEIPVLIKDQEAVKTQVKTLSIVVVLLLILSLSAPEIYHTIFP